MPCCMCSSEEVVNYCHECDPSFMNKMFCEDCTKRYHPKPKHSIEPIIRDESWGLHIITPLFDEMLFVLVFWYARNVVIEPDYFVGKMYCPVTLEVRGWISSVDLGYVTYYKDSWLKSCGIEDSFIRFYGDAWLRSIVTGNDNMVGILGGYFPALAADFILAKFGIPIIAYIFSTFFTVMWWIECWLPRTGAWLYLEELSDSLNVIDFVDEVPKASERRIGYDPTGNVIYDTYDRFYYPYRRFMRVPKYYYNRILRQLKAIVYRSRVIVTYIRVMCVFFGVGGMLCSSVVALPLFLLWQHVMASTKSAGWNVKGYIREVAGINITNLVDISLRRTLLFVVAISTIAGLCVARYNQHREMFRHIRPGTEISEQIFWSGFQFIFRLSRTATVRLLQEFFMASGVGLAVCGLYMSCRSACATKKSA